MHKCQGMTLNKVRIQLQDNDRFFGVSYVALSRAKRLQDILIDLYDDSRFEPSEKIKKNMSAVIKEEKRLLILERETLIRLKQNEKLRDLAI